MSDANTLFKRRFGHTPPHVVQAPGRLELIGNHTDYNEGLVMALTVDRHITIACVARTDGRVELVSSAFPQVEKFFVNDLKKNPAAPWTNYVKGVLEQLKRKGAYFGGFNAAIHSTIPWGAGMGSSAALAVATALAVRRMFPFSFTASGTIVPPQTEGRGQVPPLSPKEKLELAKLCQAAENKFVGVNCGLLDQVASLLGQEWHALELDCQELRVEHVPMMGEFAVVVCHSGASRSLAGGAYNELRQHCETAARKLGARCLRLVDPRYLSLHKAKLTEREYGCAYHVVGEIQRVVHGARALRGGDFEQFGHFMFQSHESSRDFFRNSTPELDALVDLARAHPACLGARLTGAGFGGATINLVRAGQVESFTQSLAASYELRLGKRAFPMTCRIGNGAE